MKTRAPFKQVDSVDEDSQGKPLREELRREHELVRSAGVISRPAMAIAFGLVFVLLAAFAAAQTGQWLSTSVLAAIGAASVAWAVYARTHETRQPTR